jgi:hypothetical protein
MYKAFCRVLLGNQPWTQNGASLKFIGTRKTTASSLFLLNEETGLKIHF